MIHCPACRVRFRLPVGFADERISCPGCWTWVDLSDVTAMQGDAWRLAREWLFSWFRATDAKDSREFLETQQWSVDYSPSSTTDHYELVAEHAKDRYEHILEISETLDKKLEELAKTSGTVVLIIAAVSSALGSAAVASTLGLRSTLAHPRFLTAAVVCLALSLGVAIWSRRPIKFRTPVTARALLKLVDDHVIS
jgi:hypothetical protein